MTPFVPLAMFGWIPFVVLLFAMLPPRRAVIVAYVLGWLFLPNANYEFAGLPDYTKITATGFAVILGAAVFDLKRLLSFRLRWYDLPMLVLCVSPVASSVSNGLGVYDGLSTMLDNVMRWALPYLTGRLYLDSRAALRDLALGFFIGGLIYVPLALWEIRMSPNLHYHLYGFRSRYFALGVRYGGYRPSVFLWSFIPVAHWFAESLLCGFWLWRSGRLRYLWGVPVLPLLFLLLVTLVLCKTLMGLVLLPLGALVLLLGARLRTSAAFLALTLAVPVVVGLRATGAWDGAGLVQLARLVDTERAESLQYRLRNENILARKALERPAFGWGGHARSRVYDERGRDISTTDGLWIIFLGRTGLVGLAALLSLFAVGLLRFVRRFPASTWGSPELAPAAVLAVLVLLGFVNNVPNVTLNPVLTLALGGLASFTTRESAGPPRGRRGRRPARKPRRPAEPELRRDPRSATEAGDTPRSSRTATASWSAAHRGARGPGDRSRDR